MKRLIIAIGLILLFDLICGGPSYAALITLQDGLNGYSGTRDTYLDEAKPSADRGIADPLFIREKDNQDEHILLYFDLIGQLPTYSSISSLDSATLSLYKSNGSQSLTVTAYLITPNNKGMWLEGNGNDNTDTTSDHADWQYRVHGTTTWIGNGATADYDAASGIGIPVGASGLTYNWDVKAIVNRWWSGADQNYGFLLMASGGEGEHKFNSSEGTYKPKLTIDYTPVPEPASLSLLSIGLLGAIGAGMRRKKS